MRKSLTFLAMVLAMLVGFQPCIGGTLAADKPPPEGGVLPDLRLPIPQNAEEQSYLGIGARGDFMIPQIKADLVILEVFSMYCPFCQKEAPNVNKLYQIIAERSDLKGKMKIIGIGAGNSPFEVDIFRKRYNIPFPLFADASFSFHEALGRVRTPYFIAVSIKDDGSHKVVYSEVGSFGDPQHFLKKILKKSGLEEGK